MKKWLIALLSVMTMMSFAGCEKKETAAEIMQKVSEKQQNAVSVGMDIAIDCTMIMGGETVEMPMSMNMQIDNPNDLSKTVMKLEMNAEFEEISIDMLSYISNGMVYNETNHVRTKESIDTDAMQNYVNQINGQMGFDTAVYNQFTVEENDSGYLISGDIDAQSMNSIVNIFANHPMATDEVTNLLGQMDIESYHIEYIVSKDYQLTGYAAQMVMKANVDSQETEMSYTYDADIMVYDKAQITLPDFTDWDIQRRACAIGSSNAEVLYFEAEGEKLQNIGSSYWFRYEDYGITTEAQKTEFNDLLKQMYGEYEGKGLTLHLQIEGDEVIVTLVLDYQNASDEALSVLSLSKGLTYSMMVLATEDLDCTNY